jgi:L-arabinokinase
MNDFFSNTEPVFTATAPGRMDVMGGIADYSGSLLLQMPIKHTTTVSIQKRNDGFFVLRTQLSKKKIADFKIEQSLLKNRSLAEAGKIIKELLGGDWAVYVIGCFLVLEKGKNISINGATIFIESKVPWGKGVSSSAALEIATMNALVKLFELETGREELAVLAQKAENLVAGAPCGLMDQLSSHLGQKNKLLPLICQPHQVFDAIKIPSRLSFAGIDSGVRHAVSGASYSDVRASAFMAYTIIALECGAPQQQLKDARESGNWKDLPYQGFLGNISTDDFENKYLSLLPESITGDLFFRQYGISIDTVTTIDPSKIYFLKKCAAHPVYENFRVNRFKELLQNFSKQTDKKDTLKKMGELMLQSHASYSSVGLGNEYTDRIVDMLQHAGPDRGVYGARITGGGSGGTVCVLNYGKEGKQTVKEVFKRFKTERNKRLFFFSGSSPGALFLNTKFR